jgi:hypothetical protein
VSRRSRMVVVALVSLVLSGDGTAFAQNPPGGRVAIGGEEVALAAPLWIWDAEAQFLSFAFFPDPPPPGAEEKAREFGDWYFDLPGRRVVLDVEFEAGQSMAMADQVTSCRVSAIGFRAELDLTGRAADCHILSIGGLLRPGGGVIGVVQGEGAGYSLHLPFSMTMGRSTACTSRAGTATRRAGRATRARSTCGPRSISSIRLPSKSLHEEERVAARRALRPADALDALASGGRTTSAGCAR